VTAFPIWSSLTRQLTKRGRQTARVKKRRFWLEEASRFSVDFHSQNLQGQGFLRARSPPPSGGAAPRSGARAFTCIARQTPALDRLRPVVMRLQMGRPAMCPGLPFLRRRRTC